MSNVSNCITSETTTSMKNQIQQHVMPLHDEPSQSTCPEPVVQTEILTTSITQKSPAKGFENKQIQLDTEILVSKNSKVKTIFTRKIRKSEQKKHRNAQVHRLVSPKTPLMIFSELFKDVPIKSQEHSINVITGYTATIEIDGQIFTAKHNSEAQAKQEACDHFLRSMLAKKMIELSKKKEESPVEIDKEDGEIGTVSKTINPPQDDFPWSLFVSLAMYNLMEKWDLQPDSESINLQEQQPKANIKQFPEDPEKYNPTQLLNEMKPSIKFSETLNTLNKPPVFEVQCELDNITFTGQGLSKKAAKKECCIAAIKYFWQFDFHAIKNDFPTKE